MQDTPQSGAWLDRLLPGSLQSAEGEVRRRARVAVVAAILLLASEGVGLLYSLVELDQRAATATGIGLLLSGGGLILLRATGSLVGLGNLLAAMLAETSAGIALLDRGILTPLLAAATAAPLIATFVPGRRWGVLWTALVVGTVGSLLLLGSSLPGQPGIIPPAQRPANAALVLSMLALVERTGIDLADAFETKPARNGEK